MKKINLILDLKKIKLTPFDYNILKGNTKDTIVLQVYSDLPNNLVDNDKIILVDTDSAIDSWKAQKYPVIAWSHKHNDDESLMAASWMILELDALTDQYLKEILCRHQGLPVTICQTERCYLRELTMDDLGRLISLATEQEMESAGRFFPQNILSYKRKINDSHSEIPSQYLKDYIRTQYPFYGFGIYAAFDSAKDAFLGIAGFSAYEQAEIAKNATANLPCQEEVAEPVEAITVEIGYAVKKEYRRQGYAKEWIHGLSRWIKEYYKPDHVDIVARIQATNEASIRTAKSCGVEIVIIAQKNREDPV